MKLLEKADRIRIYIGEDDKYKGQPLAEAIVKEARRLDLAGATVYRGLIGFGANSRIHSAKILRLSEGLPVVIEVVEHPELLDELLASVNDMMGEGMITREPVDVILYRHAEK